MTAVVIIPTTGSEESVYAIESVLNQDYPTLCYVVCDGEKFKSKVWDVIAKFQGNKNLKVCYLPENVGANGFYGHRIYASFPHLVNQEYILFLDQDCYYDTNHVRSMIELIQKENLHWAYSLRKIVDKNGNFVCNDECESLGKWNPIFDYQLIDTNCYCFKKEYLIKICQVFHGGWGQDRIFYDTVKRHMPLFNCTGEHTVNYRLNGNPNSPKQQFFEQGNKIVNDLYKGKLPWKRI